MHSQEHAGVNMAVWVHSCMNWAALTPSSVQLSQLPVHPSQLGQCSLHLRLSWPHWPFPHTGLWVLYSSTPPGSASLSSMKHQNHRIVAFVTEVTTGGHCFSPTAMGGSHRAVCSGLCSVSSWIISKDRNPHNLSGQRASGWPSWWDKTQKLSTR